MAITLYGTKLSPPVRSVLLVCKALGLNCDFKDVNLLAGEHMTPEFLKMNPNHSVPVIQDGDFTLYESHAIAAYLVGKFGKDDKLYPKDLQKRAIVDNRMHFDNGILFHRLRDVVEPIISSSAAPQPERVQKLQDSLFMFEKVLADELYVCGLSPTIADCCCAATVSSIVEVLPNPTVPPRVSAWLKRCEDNLSGYKDENKPGAQALGALIKSKI